MTFLDVAALSSVVRNHAENEWTRGEGSDDDNDILLHHRVLLPIGHLIDKQDIKSEIPEIC